MCDDSEEEDGRPSRLLVAGHSIFADCVTLFETEKNVGRQPTEALPRVRHVSDTYRRRLNGGRSDALTGQSGLSTADSAESGRREAEGGAAGPVV